MTRAEVNAKIKRYERLAQAAEKKRDAQEFESKKYWRNHAGKILRRNHVPVQSKGKRSA